MFIGLEGTEKDIKVFFFFLKYSLRFGMQRKSMSAHLMKNKCLLCY